MPNADLYIRVSTDEQADKGFSQRYQEEIIRKYCELHNIEIQATIFEDHSAKTFDRPAWNKLTEAYKKKPSCRPKYLLFTKWDRFSRNTGDAYYMINVLAKWGIQVRAIEQPLDLFIPENKIMMALFLAVPEVENERRSLNIRQGMERAKKEGRWMGSAPIGYTNTISDNGEKCIRPIEPQATIMRKAFQSIADGNTVITKVYSTAFESGLQRSLNCFRKAIRNPVYCGRINLSHDNKDKPQYSIGIHKAIISESLFSRVQEILNHRKKITTRGIVNDNFPLRGFLICTSCNKPLTGSGSKGRNKKYYYYHCLSKCRTRIRADHIHENFLMYLKTLIASEYFEDLFKSILMQMLAKATDHTRLTQDRIFNKIEKLVRRIDKARQLLLDGSIDGKDYKSIKEDAEIQINILGESLSKAMKDLMTLNQAGNDSTQYVSKLDILYELLDINGKRELLKNLFPHGIKDYQFSTKQISNAIQLVYDNSLEKFQRSQPLPEVPALNLKDNADDILKITSFILAAYNNRITATQAKEITTFLQKASKLTIDLIMEGTIP